MTARQILQEQLFNMRKYKLYNTFAEWNTKHTALMTHLEIEATPTPTYAVVSVVQNPSSSDYGKFIMPVVTTGQWKCDDQFNANDLVVWNEEWQLPIE